MNTAEQSTQEYFVQPTPEKLATLGRGCFVQVREHGDCFWVEITEGEPGRFSGTVHPELQSPCCKPAASIGPVADFRSDDITALGCDRYCFC